MLWNVSRRLSGPGPFHGNRIDVKLRHGSSSKTSGAWINTMFHSRSSVILAV